MFRPKAEYMTGLPSLFVSHGAPTLPFEDVPARSFLETLSNELAVPDAILAISAHWEVPTLSVNSVSVNSTIHDFHGFPARLSALEYPAPGSPAWSERVAELLGDAGFSTRLDFGRGLDHGAWIPLSLAYPAADIPVIQLSLQSRSGPERHFEIGRALAPLREDGVLIVGSGGLSHDLASWRRDYPGGEPHWVRSFADWMHGAITENRLNDLLANRSLAPNAVRNHPTEEHLLPLFIALGAGGVEREPARLHSSVTYGVLRMDAYAFG